MSTVRFLEIVSGEEGQRIDNYLLRILKKVPRSLVYRIVRKGNVRVNRKRVHVTYRIQSGDIVRIPPVNLETNTTSTKVASPALVQKLTESILYEDNALIIVNKPSGLAVHGGSGVSLGLIEVFRSMRGNDIELVHRLDRETSGCLMLSKRRSMLRFLHNALREGDISKMYIALVSGVWPPLRNVVRASLHKNVLFSGERRVRVNSEGKYAETKYQVLKVYGDATLMEARPVTGRTHQIRVHCLHAGHAILGDEKYGQDSDNKKFRSIGLSRMFLHAKALAFTLPSGDQLNIEAPLGSNLKGVLEKLS